MDLEALAVQLYQVHLVSQEILGGLVVLVALVDLVDLVV